MPFSTRRRFLQLAAGVAATGALALAEDSTILEPDHPILKAIEVRLARLPDAFDGFTIAQLSDFHYDENSVAPINGSHRNRQPPASGCGRFDRRLRHRPALHRHFHLAQLALRAAEPCARLLAQLQPRLGMIAVLGNHDVDANAPRVTAILHSHGIPVLRNRSIPLEQRGSRIWLCGLDSLWEGDPDINLALQPVPREELVVLLIHEPDYADQAAHYPVDLQLSGHSHGGQIWLPGIGAPWLPLFARKYPRGMHQIGPLTLYTNMGLGTIRVPVRLNCPPKVTLFTLRCA